MTVTFLNLPLVVRKKFIDYPYFANLGMLQNAAVLKKEGFEVHILDGFALPESSIVPFKAGYHIGCSLKAYLKALEELPLEVIVIASNPFLKVNRKQIYLRKVLEKIKSLNPHSMILLADCYVGGMHYIDYPAEEIFAANPEIDFLIKYHGEAVLPDFLKKLHTKTSRQVLFGRAEDIHFDDLPFPAWEDISVENYMCFLLKGFTVLGKNPLLRVRGKTLPILTSRGCLFSCSFCSSNPDERASKQRTYLTHSIEYLEKYINWLASRWGVNHLVVLDEIANLDPQRFERVVELLNAQGFSYAIPNGLRADRLTRHLLEKMKGRLDMLSISAESGDPSVLRQIVKGKTKPEAVERVARWCQELNLPLLIHYMIGFPGETELEINRTLFEALRMNREYGAQISLQFATPLPGTELYQICQKRGVLPEQRIADYSEWFTKEPILQTEVGREKLKLFKKSFELALNSKETRKIIVNMTYRCNNHCIFCATGDMPPIDADVKKTKAKLKNAFANGIRQLDFDGGEPTLHPGLFEVIRFARELGFQEINLTTNGRLLAYPGFARKIVNSGIKSLLISLHGHSRELHRSSTSEAESFQQTVAGIKNALQYKPPYLRIGVNITLTRMNYFQLRDFAAFVFSLGIRILNIQFLTPFGRATKAMVPPMDTTTKNVKEVIEEFGSRMTINLANIQPCFMEGYEAFALSDFAKSERQMLFCTDYADNLYHYLSHKRKKTKVCHSCPYSIICEGFYDFESKVNNNELQGIAL